MGEKGSPRGKRDLDRNCRITPKEEPSSSAEERGKRSTRKRANRASALTQKGRHPPIQPSWTVAEEKERESPETGTPRSPSRPPGKKRQGVEQAWEQRAEGRSQRGKNNKGRKKRERIQTMRARLGRFPCLQKVSGGRSGWLVDW